MRSKPFIIALLVVIASISGFAQAAEQPAPELTLISNVNIFDGKTEKLHKNMHVLVKDNLIETVSNEPLAVIQTDNVTMIDGGGRTLIPGLTDAHVHIMWNDDIEDLIYNAPEGYSGVLAAVNARNMLLRGFTTVRDCGGPSFGLKRAIDAGYVEGPRILPSGAFISQSSGHGDYDTRMFYLSPHFTGQIDKAYIRGWTVIADGVPEVQKAAREILRSGAT
ncbi:amidohydrolase family protein, partial [Pseudomonadota bacterium]